MHHECSPGRGRGPRCENDGNCCERGWQRSHACCHSGTHRRRASFLKSISRHPVEPRIGRLFTGAERRKVVRQAGERAAGAAVTGGAGAAGAGGGKGRCRTLTGAGPGAHTMAPGQEGRVLSGSWAASINCMCSIGPGVNSCTMRPSTRGEDRLDSRRAPLNMETKPEIVRTQSNASAHWKHPCQRHPHSFNMGTMTHAACTKCLFWICFGKHTSQ